MQNSITEERMAVPPRSSFLTILCILTFLGSAYGIISGAIAYSNADSVTELTKNEIKKSQEEVAKSEAPAFAKKLMADTGALADPGKLKMNGILTILSNLITFVGAFLMFRLKPAGFWVYVVGTILGVVAPLFVFGNTMLTGLMIIMPAIVGIAFIALYAFNLKDMKPQPVYD